MSTTVACSLARQLEKEGFALVPDLVSPDQLRGMQRGFASRLSRLRWKDVVEVPGRAGTAFLFDTSCVHRQNIPILEERHAAFFNYHDPGVPLRQEDIEYYRYHPLLLNAAFLGDLSAEEQRILGFGDKT